MAGAWRRTVTSLGSAAAVAAALLAPVTATGAAAGHAPQHGTTYVNPVSRTFADTFADPAVIRGKDGWWYAYGTTDPLREGEGTRHLIPTSRSRDLVTWEYVGDAFTETTLPSWAAPGAALWAPDIRYVDGEYRLYYVVTETTVTAEPNDNAIGVATAPTPTGPWTDSGGPVVGPRRGDSGNPGDFKWTFDPTAVTDRDGSQHLFYGSYYGGVFVAPLDATGTETTGDPTMVAIDNKFEGTYVIRRGGWWYLFASTANCCAGPTTGYSVQVGRSRDLRGPYVDREGVPLLQSRAGGTPVLYQNGNRWIGAGHNAVTTDLAGQDWIVYHAIDRADPYLDGTEGINERPMLIDRLDWVRGWPYVRGGRGPSETPQRGPVAQAGPSKHVLGGDVRVEGDIRQAAGNTRAGLAAGVHPGQHRAGVAAYVDARSRQLVLTGAGRTRTAALPATYQFAEWHSLVLEVRGDTATAELSHARLGDPFAVVRLDLRDRLRPGRAGTITRGPGAQVANFSAKPAAAPLRHLAPVERPGRLDPGPSDEFAGALEPGWETVRTPETTVAGGHLRWPVEAGDLVGPGNNASVLLRRPPAGDWTAETKLTIDLGTDTVRNFQQGGLIAYVTDDLITRLSHVAIWNTRQTEFGKEMPYAGRLQFGGTIIGPPAETTWLRLTHRTDPNNGEHELRAFTSRDGRTWIRGGVWTLPADADLRVGLISHGWNPADPRATAAFDYLRFYRD